MAATPAAKPAAPQLPASGTEADVDEHPLVDDAEWWQLAFTGADASDAEAEGFTVEATRLSRVDLSGGRWTKGAWRNCVFEDGNLANTHASDCGLQRSSFATMRMTGWQWTNGVVKDVTFTGCRMDLAGLRFSRLRHVVFDGCRLTGVDLTNAELTSVRFTNCDLTGARLHHATMDNVRLEGCVLEDVTGVEALRGATVASGDLLPLTFSMAASLGITVEYSPTGN